MNSIAEIWVYLSASPLLWLTATILAYLLALAISAKLGGTPLANSVLIAGVLIIVLLQVTQTSYISYFEGAQFVHFLLGPATVALAIPLYKNLEKLRRSLLPIAGALIAGSLTAMGSAVAIATAFGAPADVVASIAPKSTSAPIAMELARNLGGIPSLAAVLVILTGILGAVIVTPLMNALRIKDYAARGFAVGVASHGIGTARAFQVSEVAGAFSGIAMALNGALTSILVLVWVLLSQA
ncbi:membrane protein [Devosia riboflavina]|uniref:Membrane protein n=1 Tax=Devosia riboflavina TaxID=46914 RepID=A0A087M0W2_9HYPH|nr:LrgB family protein [Devosia riboflavina]KFL30515.1 membrane protein [Devosia riboflavina]